MRSELRVNTTVQMNTMTSAEMTEAIPPAYTQFIGEQLFTALEAAA